MKLTTQMAATKIEPKASDVKQSTCPLCFATETSNFMSAPDRFHLRRTEYQLMRCSSCTGVWLASPPTPEEMAFHYDQDYHQTISAGGEVAAASRWNGQKTCILAHKQSGAILDIGCSSGGFLGTMRDDGWRLYGIEIAPEVAERARKNTGAEVFAGDALMAPFPAANFDVVTCFDVLEHVYDPRQFLTKVHEWLKPGGVCYALLPNIDSWEATAFGSYWYGLELPRHLFHFSPKSLRHLMTSLGFAEVFLRTPKTCYVERSVGYLCERALEGVGVAVTPQSKAKPATIAWRAARKAIRVTVLGPYTAIASLAGAGGSMEAMFEKPLMPASISVSSTEKAN